MGKKPSKKKTTKEAMEKKENENWAIEITQSRSDVKSFLEKFKADVVRKKEEYQKYAQESRKREK